MAVAQERAMIETVFMGLWVAIAILLCVTIKQALRQHSREVRRNEIRSYRRFLGHQGSRRRHRRQTPAMQPAAA